MHSKAERVLRVGALVAFPLMVGGLALLHETDHPGFYELTAEDGILENLTVVHLLFGALFAGMLARGAAEMNRPRRPFYLIFSAFCVFAALEELSWGQRIFGVESPEFFVEHSDQAETNLHNVFQLWTGVRTRQIAGMVLFVYGGLLPLARLDFVARLSQRFGVPLPPAFLAVGFTLGGVAAYFDAPTGREEELSEYMLSLCLALFMVSEWLQARGQRPDPKPAR